MRHAIAILPLLFATAALADAPAPVAVQSATNRPPIGETASPYVWYDSSVAPTAGPDAVKAWKKAGNAATNVVIAGDWSSWTGRYPLVQVNPTLWRAETRNLGARVGKHQFKFIVNGVWESGENRDLPINLNGEAEAAPDEVLQCVVEDFKLIRVFFKDRLPDGIRPSATLDPPVPVAWTEVVSEMQDASLTGYLFSRGTVTFLFDPETYGLKLSKRDTVAVAGNFTGWDGSGGYGGKWLLKPDDSGTRRVLSAQLDGMRLPKGETERLFKFVVNGKTWLPPPAKAPNRLVDAKGNANLHLNLAHAGGAEIRIHTSEPLDISRNYAVRLEGVADRPLGLLSTPDGIFDRIRSEKPMGVTFDRAAGTTTFRLFAPRATDVWLCFFERAQAVTWKPKFKRFPPDREYRMRRDADGVWELTLNSIPFGAYYGFRVAGPEGDGEAFDPYHVVGDPYARAAATANGLSILVDPDATNRWFSGWTDQDWVTPDPQDLVIYECHVRGQTIHPSSGVPSALRGTYAGLVDSLKRGTGLAHAKALGATAVELLPISEFSESEDPYNWGYSTVYYFAPESSYGSNPTNGAAYYEFKALVDELHRQGFAVILDVVYNHVGGPNIFSVIDKKCYFRLLPDLSFSNHSACGNDFRTETPMGRRLVVDNIRHWMREFHVDGFRLDLAELVDMATMMDIINAAREENPKAILIAEPWSPGRGENKQLLRGTGWSAWNNDFRYAAKDFARGGGNRDWLKNSVFGSVATWAQNPLQPVNYLESHDDMAFADEISSNPNHDGRTLNPRDAAVNRLAATILFTSLGKTMLYEGQEFLRSKWGINDTYNRGDAVNAIRWTDRDRPLARETLDYYTGLIHLRTSPEGAAFRVASRPPSTYYRWILPSNPRLFGYVVNVPELHAGRGFVVLFNTGDAPARLSLTLPGDTPWRQIADGTTVNLAGLPSAPLYPPSQPATLSLPPLSSLILMNGF